jgi:hypothetical protein
MEIARRPDDIVRSATRLCLAMSAGRDFDLLHWGCHPQRATFSIYIMLLKAGVAIKHTQDIGKQVLKTRCSEKVQRGPYAKHKIRILQDDWIVEPSLGLNHSSSSHCSMVSCCLYHLHFKAAHPKSLSTNTVSMTMPTASPTPFLSKP